MSLRRPRDRSDRDVTPRDPGFWTKMQMPEPSIAPDRKIEADVDKYQRRKVRGRGRQKI